MRIVTAQGKALRCCRLLLTVASGCWRSDSAQFIAKSQQVAAAPMGSSRAVRVVAPSQLNSFVQFLYMVYT
jgi:hypothetical protein